MAPANSYDYIVAGSGTSGAVAAYILQQAGARCLLLEAGKRYRTQDFPLPESEYTPQMFWGGGAEFNTDCDMAFLRGRCVGGGSVINGALMDRFDAVAFDDWRTVSGVDFFTEGAMDPHYRFAEEQITLQTIPEEHYNNNARLFIKAMENQGHIWKPLQRCQSDCGTDEGNDCICCLGGCHRGSKQTMMDTYIPRAEALGLEVAPEVYVDGIETTAEEVRFHCRQNGSRKTFASPKAVLAASAPGTTQLLLRSGFRSKLPALGEGFAMHPQFMNFAVFDEPVDAHKGVLQGVKSLDPDFRKRGFKLENVFAPPIAVAVLVQKLGAGLRDFMDNYRHFACIEVAVRDENAGRLDVDRKGRLKIHKQLTDQDRRRMEDGMETVRAMFESLNPREIHQCPNGFGLHLMGGCAIGTNPQSSVVDPEFRVHGEPKLYVADSSVFPNAPGINPALTIMALSHRMATSAARN